MGMFDCVDEWDGFEKDLNAGKADLLTREETDDDILTSILWWRSEQATQIKLLPLIWTTMLTPTVKS